MSTKRLVIWISVAAVTLLLVCGGAAVWYAVRQDSDPPVAETGTTKLLTLDGAQTQTRLDLPPGTTLLYSMFYAELDWTVAVQARFDRAALPGFLTTNKLPAPVDGLRPVPGLVPMPEPLAVDPSASPGASAPPTAPSPPPALLREATDWHPERPVTVSGIPRHVQNGVARWFMFDLDDPTAVTVYIYAAAEIPASSRTFSPAPSPTGSP